MTIRSTLFLILNIVSTIVGLTLGAHIILQILGVNDSVPIIQWISSVSAALAAPFNGLFSNIVLTENSVIDVNAVIALVVYSIVFSLIYRLLSGANETNVVETERTYHAA